MLSTGLWNTSGFRLRELQPRCLRSVASLRQWSCMLYTVHLLVNHGISVRLVAVVSCTKFFRVVECIDSFRSSFLPVSISKLERTFSQVKLIKCSKRASLGNDTLNDLLTLNTDKRPLQGFSPETAIDLWWDAKARKPSHGPRKQYKKRTPHGQTSETPTSETPTSQRGGGGRGRGQAST